MSEVVAYLLAIAITLPVPIAILVFVFALKILRHKWRAIHFTVNTTTFLFIMAVNANLFVIFDKSYFAHIFIVLILLLGGLVILQWKLNQEIKFRKAWKGFWRLSFLLFIFAYIGLTFYGLIDRLLAL